MAFTEASSPSPGRAWRGGFKVFLFGALCYTICTTKAPPQALEGPGEEPSWHLRKPPLQALEGPGEEASRCSCLVLCAIQYAQRRLLPRPWGGAFMAFKLAKVLGNTHATHGSGLGLINCIVADHSQL